MATRNIYSLSKPPNLAADQVRYDFRGSAQELGNTPAPVAVGDYVGVRGRGALHEVTAVSGFVLTLDPAMADVGPHDSLPGFAITPLGNGRLAPSGGHDPVDGAAIASFNAALEA